MAVFVNGGKNGSSIKRCKGRFGGDSAHRQHRYDKADNAHVVANRRRADEQFHESMLHDGVIGFEESCDDNVGGACPCTGVKPILNGPVREGNILLVYAQGKLLSAHCG